MKMRILSIMLCITVHFCVTGQQEYRYSGLGDCLAHYTSTYDSLNPSLVYFQDESQGNPVSWYWDFGDPESGTDNTSKLQNPLHQFTSSGVFYVCLTITNADTLHPCINEFCNNILIDLTYNCHAYFYVIKDSTNVLPNSFKFFDQSTGNPNHFHWDFGDGASSDIKNPDHYYANSGNYNVCLKIIRSDSSGVLCMDSLCRQVNVINYYKLGGHAFAGLFPINNPVSTGDTGIAYLYRLSNSEAALLDTNEFFYLGYFTFPHIAQGRYIVKVVLKSTSTHFQNYLPTYYPDALHQENALQIEINDSSVFNADIYLHPLNPGISEITSPGEVIGYPYPDPVKEDLYVSIRAVKDCRVYLDVMSVFGTTMINVDYSITKGQNTVKIPVGSLP